MDKYFYEWVLKNKGSDIYFKTFMDNYAVWFSEYISTISK